jgi:hypothetical protein
VLASKNTVTGVAMSGTSNLLGLTTPLPRRKKQFGKGSYHPCPPPLHEYQDMSRTSQMKSKAKSVQGSFNCFYMQSSRAAAQLPLHAQGGTLKPGGPCTLAPCSPMCRRRAGVLVVHSNCGIEQRNRLDLVEGIQQHITVLVESDIQVRCVGTLDPPVPEPP